MLIAQTIAVDSDQAPGVVISINPTPGTTITAGSGVVLEIASGNVQVPSLVGLNEIGAKTVLTQAAKDVENAVAQDLLNRGDKKRSTTEIGDALVRGVA